MKVPTTTATAMPKLYLGTMTFGWSQTSSAVDRSAASQMLRHFVASHPDGTTKRRCYVDTARIYAGGKTEQILGEVLDDFAKDDATLAAGAELLLGTKAHPSQPGGLSADGIASQLTASLDALGVKSVEEFYLHQPDPDHPLVESLRATHQLVSDGTIEAVGMSNYQAVEMDRAFRLCDENGYAKPTVYQGLYNPLNRAVESELLPVLREHGCSFVAYNPLAAGLLTWKHARGGGKGGSDEVKEGRFKNNPNYLPRFYTDANFDALDLIKKACDAHGITMVEATYRWLLRHSALKPEHDDGVLLGASSVSQLEQNLAGCAAADEKGPLPDDVLRAFDDAWDVTKDDAFPYWRSYSSDMPGREGLDPGASYSATKK